MPQVEDTQFNLAALLVLAALSAVIALGYASGWPGTRKSDMPSGPRAWPIVGNFLSLKRTGRFQQLQDLHAQYGDIISLKLGSNTLISIAGDGTHVHELLDKRGSIYSNRPVNILTAYATQDDNFLFKQDKEIWRIGRKQIIQQFGPNTMIRSERFMLQEAESVQLLYDCLRTPDKLSEHSIRYTASVITCLTYGVRCESFEDPAVHGVEHLLQFGGGIYVPGGKPPIVAFPWMNYLPEFVFPWRKKARRYGQMMDSLYGGKSPFTHPGNTHRLSGLYEIGRQRGDEGLNPGCFAYKVWTDAKHTGLTKRQQIYLCGVVLEGGSDIVSMLISTCILGLIHSLESQARARAEIDGIYDQDNLPSWRDEQSLPFVRAGLVPFPNQVSYIIDNTGWMTVIKEAMRWRPPLPIAVAHRLERDDYYNGLFFPKDSIVLCNSWSIHMNPDRFNESDKFKPERYLGHDASMQEYVSRGDPLKRDHFSFGAGRRVCPGIQTAEQSIFIAISRLLWAFKFSAPPGCRVDVDQKTAFRGEGIRGPVPFPVIIKPRSEARVWTIEREMTNVKEVYARYGVYKVPLSDL